MALLLDAPRRAGQRLSGFPIQALRVCHALRTPGHGSEAEEALQRHPARRLTTAAAERTARFGTSAALCRAAPVMGLVTWPRASQPAMAAR